MHYIIFGFYVLKDYEVTFAYLDGLSVLPILLMEFITTLATTAAQPVTRGSRLFHFLNWSYIISGGFVFEKKRNVVTANLLT